MDRITARGGGLQRLAADFEAAGERSTQEMKGVVSKGALNVKNDAKKRVGRGPYTPGYAATIGYDLTTGFDFARAEIGPDKDKQVGGGPYRTPGNLGALLEYEYGTPWSAPTPHLGPALEAEAPRFEKALEDALVKALNL